MRGVTSIYMRTLQTVYWIEWTEVEVPATTQSISAVLIFGWMVQVKSFVYFGIND